MLENANSALLTVDLGGNSIDNTGLLCFANSLALNCKLNEMFLYEEDDLFQDEEDPHDGVIAITNWDALLNVLCNKSSIDATFNSNHTLQRVIDPQYLDGEGESELPSDLTILLKLNRENNKAEAARRKILDVHFSGSFSMQLFINMELKSFPHFIAWMARDEHGSSLLYQIVRNTTLFVNIGGAMKTEIKPDSKRRKM